VSDWGGGFATKWFITCVGIADRHWPVRALISFIFSGGSTASRLLIVLQTNKT